MPVMKQSSAAATTAPSNSNDLVIRDGFPALSRPDGNGPLIDGEEPFPRHPFASYTDALSIPDSSRSSMLEDCKKVFSARTREDAAAYSAGCTYFVPSQMKPRCALEALALSIFKAHTKGLDGMYNPEQSGAEWWTLVMDAAKRQETNEMRENQDDDEENEDDEVGIHFDADYGLEAQAPDLLLHPRVGTVTYLSNVGAPTLVLNKSSPPPSDLEKKSLNGNIDRGWLSGPQFGKHIAFDGRLLHGAPALFFPGNSIPERSDAKPAAKRQKTQETIEQAQHRVTFLVNVWLNHCPLDAELLDDDVVKGLTTPWEESPVDGSKQNGGKNSDESYKPPFQWNIDDLLKGDSMGKITFKACEEDPAGSDEVVICNHLVTVIFGASMNDLHDAASETAGGKNVELEFEAGSLRLEVGNKVQEEEGEDDGDDEQGADGA